MYNNLAKKVDFRRKDLIDFLRELIQIPSVSKKEKEIARLIEAKMLELNYDFVKIDGVGNVIGIIRGGDDSPLLYNGHMDTVPPGEMVDPYSAKIMEGEKFGVKGRVIYGRGACDMKGALAAMVIAGGLLKENDIKLKGDLIVTCSVMEELAESFGSEYLITANNLKPKVAVVGEATNLDITIGHRGLLYPEITVRGRSCHASAPERGINALYKMSKIIEEVQKLATRLPEHPFLGKASMSINTISLIPGTMNVVPERCSVSVDTRSTPELNAKDVVGMLEKLIQKLKMQDPELNAEVKLMEVEEESYTGYKKRVKKSMPPFYTDPSNPYVTMARNLINNILGREPKIKPWVFGTDSSSFAKVNAVTFGFGPGEERFAHSSEDNIKIEDVLLSTKVYTLLPIEILGTYSSL